MEKVSYFCLNGIDEKGNETNLCLKELTGKDKDIIIYFYPKDNTPGCTIEAVDFRDHIKFIKQKAFVIGISPNSVKSHKKFMDKYHLNFYLLSDPELKVIKDYDAYGEKILYGKKSYGVIRTTIL